MMVSYAFIKTIKLNYHIFVGETINKRHPTWKEC